MSNLEPKADKIADRLKLARTLKLMNQQEFSEMLGVHKNTISKWERGLAEPDLSSVSMLCKKMGLSAYWLINGEGPMYEVGRDIKVELKPGMKAGEIRGYALQDIAGGPEFDTQAASLLAKFDKYNEAFTVSGDTEAMQARIKALEAEVARLRASEQKAKEEALEAYKRLANKLEDKAKP